MKAIVIVLLICILLVSAAESAQPGQIIAWTMSGAAAGQSTRYALLGTLGQPDAGQSAGTHYTASWGFWKASPLQTIDALENGYFALERSVTFGDIFKAFAFLVVVIASLARWAVAAWSLA